MEQDASSFGDHRPDRAGRFIHDRLGGSWSRRHFGTPSWRQPGRRDPDWPIFEEREGVGGQDHRTGGGCHPVACRGLACAVDTGHDGFPL